MSDWKGVRGKRVLLTGGTDGIGLAAAEVLAARGAKLAITARNEAKAKAAVSRIKAAGENRTSVDVLFADLSSQASVRRLASEVLDRYSRIDVLINNAGAMYSSRQLTEDGVELTWALNHLSPFLLTSLLLERMKGSPSRIITTSSVAHQFCSHIRFDDANAENFYFGFGRYAETKLANILFTVELARRLSGTGVTANCFHPGLVATSFNRNNGTLQNLIMAFARPFSRSPEKGAETLVYLADSPEVADTSGAYFVDCQQGTTSAAAADSDSARRLWKLSEQQVGISSKANAVSD